jgi:xanthine dehydrogenase YagT iron-sulfur-binding subunit
MASPISAPTAAATLVGVMLKINGREHHLDVEPRAVLLDVLREQLGLTGAKKGCDHGQCGACTVLVNGRRQLSCLSLAASLDGAELTTIEGLEQNGKLHPLQTAFLEHDGFQCGYCTGGQIMSAVGLLSEPIPADDAAVREAMSGNICRCGAYQRIVAAIQAARGRNEPEKAGSPR